MNGRGKRTRSLVWCALFVALIAAGAFVKIPTPTVPLTLQFFFVLAAGLLLGARRGLACTASYVALGLLGVPVFAKGGGLWYVTEPTFGYLLGFCAGAAVAGLVVGPRRNPGYGRLCLAALGALVAVYVPGFLYCVAATSAMLGVPAEWGALFVSGVLLCLPGDLATGMVAVLLAKRLIPVLRLREDAGGPGNETI